MSERTVVYLMSFPAHAPYLATSLLTLRRHWAGNVEVYAWKESIDIARALCHDKRINADAIEVDEIAGRTDKLVANLPYNI
jgi:16S rRNA A1518/A1519 N6-dimethyltransferase RsmA/KsgA/DIM1 with predicted DNA glycosylase/AP lyase activity